MFSVFDLLIIRSSNRHLLSAVYRKPTHSDRYLILGVSNVIHFWRSLPREKFPELRKFAQSYILFYNSVHMRTSIFVREIH